MAAILGGVIGYERESQRKSAGLRTHILVGLGSAMFVVIPLQAGVLISDLSRVLQGLVAGIGFWAQAQSFMEIRTIVGLRLLPVFG